MTLFVLEPSLSFSVLHDYVTVTVIYVTPSSHFVTYMTIIYNIISHLSFFKKNINLLYEVQGQSIVAIL